MKSGFDYYKELSVEEKSIILEFYDPKEGPNSGWVHASYAEGANRKQKLTAVTEKGKTVYKPGFLS